MRDLEVIGVRVEMPTNSPVVLLRERDGGRYLPIWVGAAEATAIAYAQQGIVPPRPLTHDLLRDVVDALGARLAEVQVTALEDGVFYALLVFGNGVEVSARPSDAIALALRAEVPILATDAVLDAAGIDLPDEGDEPEGGDGASAPGEDEVEEFRAFLEQVSPEDFG